MTVLEKTQKSWRDIADVLSVPRNKKEYDRAVKLLNDLADVVGQDENHPMAALMETLGLVIEAYESRNLPEPKNDPVGALEYLMAEHGLKQSDLTGIIGQSHVSEILNGKRKLNARQIKALSEYFGVSPALFL